MKALMRTITVMATSFAFAGCQSDMQIIAHRGASHLAPENTVAAANLAWEKQADAVEVDVYLSRDRKIMVIHDSTTKRTTGKARDLKIADHTAEELRRLDVGTFKDKAYTGERIPLLEEIIATIPPEGRLFVEIKCGAEILDPLKQIIEASDQRDRIVIIGFGLDTVKAAKRQMPNIPTYWLVGTRKNNDTGTWIPHSPTLVDQLAGSGLDGLNVHWAGVTREFAQCVQTAGLDLYAWTVNDPAEAARLQAFGIRGITTDRPGWLRDQLQRTVGREGS